MCRLRVLVFPQFDDREMVRLTDSLERLEVYIAVVSAALGRELLREIPRLGRERRQRLEIRNDVGAIAILAARDLHKTHKKREESEQRTRQVFHRGSLHEA